MKSFFFLFAEPPARYLLASCLMACKRGQAEVLMEGVEGKEKKREPCSD